MLNHLSPGRNLRNLKENEDLKSVDALTKFQELEDENKEQIVLSENRLVKAEDLTEEMLMRILINENKPSLDKKGNSSINKLIRRLSKISPH